MPDINMTMQWIAPLPFPVSLLDCVATLEALICLLHCIYNCINIAAVLLLSCWMEDNRLFGFYFNL